MTLEGNFLEQIWLWYWVGKAQVGALGLPVVDQIAPAWNSVMGSDILRGAALVVVPLGTIAAFYDALLALDDEHRSPRPAPAAAAGASEPPPADLTGEELRRELARLGRTQTELAEALGVSRGYVSKLIGGSKPFTQELQGQCRAILAVWDVDRS